MVELNTCRGQFYECKDELDGCFKKLQEARDVFVNGLDKRIEDFSQKIQKYVKTGDLEAAGLGKASGLGEAAGLVNAAGLGEAARALNNESDQENVPVRSNRGLRKKPILAESTEVNLQEVQIKKEKISSENQSETTRSSATSTVSSILEIPADEVKKERDMPAPTWIPPKKKQKAIKTERASVRTTRTKGKKPSVRDSDVIVQSTPITTINLSDTESDGEKKAQKEERTTRSTRTKTKKAQAEPDSGAETDTESTRSTRTKTRTKKIEGNNDTSEVEETRSTRTKTLRKGKKVEDECQKDEPEEPPQEARSTRTKTMKKAAKGTEEQINSNNNKIEEETAVAQPELVRSSRANAKKIPEINTETVVASDIQMPDDISEASKTGSKSNHQANAKRNRSNSTDEEANERKRSKSISPVQEVEANATAQTVYEDAHSSCGPPQENTRPPLNSTYVAEATAVSGTSKKEPVHLLNATVTVKPSSSNAANSTVIVDKPQFNLFDKNSIDAMFTDDDSIETKKTPAKKAPISKASKEVFSPYEKTTIKKKVEAFEKLQNGSEIPLKASSNLRSLKDTPTAVKEKAKMFTPAGTKFCPSSSSTSKISKFISQQHNSTSSESLLAVKSAQKESRDRQKRQLEREQALKKKDAMLQAQAEARRKLNEEKQLKAQQQRKALEAEKLKQLEAQKQKEAKIKQREQEREEYLQKQKLELEKKRHAQKKKLAEMQAQRQQILEEQARNPPIYMTSKPPRLPTEDCYDSDDQEYKKVTPSSWCRENYYRRKLLTMLAAGEKIKNTLFCRHAQTPDLVDIFEVIDPKKLKRSSSVLWRKPPRYTMMPDLNNTRFQEDDELYDSD